MGHVGKGREGKPLATKTDEFSEKLQKAKCLLNIKDILNIIFWIGNVFFCKRICSFPISYFRLTNKHISFLISNVFAHFPSHKSFPTFLASFCKS